MSICTAQNGCGSGHFTGQGRISQLLQGLPGLRGTMLCGRAGQGLTGPAAARDAAPAIRQGCDCPGAHIEKQLGDRKPTASINSFAIISSHMRYSFLS